MARLWPVALTVLLLAWIPPLAADVPSGAVAPVPPAAVTEADAVEVDLIRQRTHAVGNATLSYGSMALHADEISADRTSGEVEASGHLAITQQSRRLTGVSLRYNLNTSVGSLEEARVVEQGVFITGQKLTFAPDRIVARDAQFTTCSDDKPHYAFAASDITLTAQQATPSRPPMGGRLTLDHARIMYHGRKLFSLPKYSVSVGDIGKKDTTPLPTTGFSRADGPFTSFMYALGSPDSGWYGGLNYRYTTFKGIRASLLGNAPLGPARLTLGYYRRQDPADREIEPDDLTATTSKVLVNREPEYGIVMPERGLGRHLALDVSWLSGRYREILQDGLVEHAKADRDSVNLLVKILPYHISRSVQLSHAIGWRHSSYSTGDEFDIRLYRNSIDWRANPRLRIKLSHVTRDTEGATPFFFDGVSFPREIVGEFRYVVSPAWRLRFADYYDPDRSRSRDMIIEATRTAHCLEYTLGWRKERGTFYVGFGIAPPAAAGGD